MTEHDDLDDLVLWNEAASAYASVVGTNDDGIWLRFEPWLNRYLDPIGNRDVLDLGCGHGWLSGKLADRGATVTGVDGSDALVAVARRDHQDIVFDVVDLRERLALADSSFDLVVCHMVVMDLSTLDVISEVSRVLRSGGMFVMTALHPCFFSHSPVEDPDGEHYRKVRGYLDNEERWIESFGGHRHYHRPLSTYISALGSAGLAVIDMFEPPTPPGPAALEKSQSYIEWFPKIPTMFGLAATRLHEAPKLTHTP